MLELENPDLFRSFERCVSCGTSDEQATNPGSSQAFISGRLKFERAENVIRERYRERHDASLTGKSEIFRRCFEQTIRAIGAFKSTISTAISSEIHASLAWTAVCLILPVSTFHIPWAVSRSSKYLKDPC